MMKTILLFTIVGWLVFISAQLNDILSAIQQL